MDVGVLGEIHRVVGYDADSGESKQREYHALQSRLQIFVGGDLPGCFMPEIIDSHEAPPVVCACRLEHLLIKLLEFCNLLGCGHQGSLLECKPFQNTAYSINLAHVSLGQLGNVGRGVAALGDEPFHLELNQRFTNGREAGAQFRGQLAFDQPLPLLHRAAQNGFAKGFSNTATQAVIGQALECRTGHRVDYIRSGRDHSQVEAELISISLSACFKASEVTFSPESMRPISRVRAATSSSSTVAM